MKLLSISGLLILMSSFCFSQRKIENTKLSIFNNGRVFIHQENVFDKNDSVYVLPIPETAVAGTYWLLSATKDNDIKQIKYEYTPLPLLNENEAIVSALYKSKKSELKIKNNLKQSFFGTIEKINLKDSCIILKQRDAKDSLVTIPLYSINHIEELNVDKPQAYSFHIPKIERRANVIPLFANKKLDLKEYYLRNNMNWYASTFFKIIDKKEASFIIRVTIENDLQDFHHAEVNLLLNTPLIDNLNEEDPLVKDRISVQGGTAQSFVHEKRYAKAMPMMASRMADVQEADEITIEQIESLANMQAYNFKNISLPKSSKNSFIYFNKNIAYKNFYQVSLQPNYFGMHHLYETNTIENKAFFHTSFTNTTGNYIPTNSILFSDNNGDIIAKKSFQSLAPLTEVDFELIQANDINIKNKEEIHNITFIKNVNDKEKLYRYTIKGKILIENFKRTSEDLRINKMLDQTMRLSPLEKTIQNESTKIISTENNSGKTIQWNVLLNANEKKELSYEYEKEQIQYH